MSSRSRGRGRGYMGRGNYGHFHQGRDERHGSSHKEAHHSMYRGRGHHYHSKGDGSEYGGHTREMPPQGPRDHHSGSQIARHHRREPSRDHSHDYHSSNSRHSPPPHHRRGRSPPQRNPDQILAKLAPEEQVVLTKALVDTVLKRSVSFTVHISLSKMNIP